MNTHQWWQSIARKVTAEASCPHCGKLFRKQHFSGRLVNEKLLELSTQCRHCDQRVEMLVQIEKKSPAQKTTPLKQKPLTEQQLKAIAQKTKIIPNTDSIKALWS